MRKTKVIATIGPSTDNLDTIKKLILSGVNVFRLNFSHGDHESHKKNIDLIREAEEETGKFIAILQDISGPKIRVGDIDGFLELNNDDEWYLSAENILGDRDIPFKNKKIFKDILPNSLIYFADGVIRAKAINFDGEKVKIKILVGGKLTSRKGVNFPNLTLSISSITEKDKKDIEFGVKHGVDIAAISFVQTKNDVLEARSIASQFGTPPMIIPKIEKLDAVENIDEILSVSDGVMVARGDLGVEVGVEYVPAIQKKIIKKANKLGIPAIVATQMLISMIKSPYPTRAEVSDVANAVLDGTDAVMLSDETAVGEFPLKAIEVLNATIREIETIYPYYQIEGNKDHSDAIAASVSKMSEAIKPEAIIIFTLTGSSAQKVSKFRPKSEISATTTSMQTARKLNLTWGINPSFIVEKINNSDDLINEYSKEAIRKGWIKKDKTYIYVMGYPTGKAGTTNLIRLAEPSFFADLHI